MQHKTYLWKNCDEAPIAERVRLETLKPINVELLVGKFKR